MSVFDTLLSDFFGNSVLMSVIILFAVLMLVMFIKTSKYVIEGLALLVVYGFTKAGYVPVWVFFITIVIIGLDIGKLIISMFFGSR